MKLEELIYKRLTSFEDVTGRVTSYYKNPAIFLQKAPDDQQEGWNGSVQYPRIVYLCDMHADEERKTSGTLAVDFFCDELGGITPEEVEPYIKACFSNILLNPDGDSVYGIAWNRSDAFSAQSRETGADISVIGVSIQFDLYEYVDQITTTPDPILAVQSYIQDKWKEVQIIDDRMTEDFIEYTDDRPAVYVKENSLQRDHVAYALAWATSNISIHVLAPSSKARKGWMKVLFTEIFVDSDMLMEDGSVMQITEVNCTSTSDYLTDGQITLDALYTIPTKRQGTMEGVNKLNKATFDRGSRKAFDVTKKERSS